MNHVSFEAACGASELAANAYILEAHGVRLLLDAGASQGRAPEWVEGIEPPDVCWISHAHWDHCGALAPLKGRFPRLPCLSSASTRRLMPVALARAGVDSGRSSALASQLQSLPTRRYFELSTLIGNPAATKLRLMVFPAGHIPGAGTLLVEIDRDERRPFRLLYTGDFCGHDQPGLPGALFPRTGDDFPIDVMVMEGVMATRKSYDEVDYAEQFAGFTDAVKERAGGALIGASSLGQAAQIVAGLVESGVEPTVHTLLEPVLEAARLESTTAAIRDGALDFADDASCRRALAAGKAVVAPGEQFQRSSPAGRLLGAVAGRDDGLIVVVNRAYKNAAAGRLLTAGRGDKIRCSGRSVALQARVARFLLSNHAPRHQLVAAVNAVDPGRVVLVHGHRSHLFALSRALEKSGFSGVIDVPQNHHTLALSPAAREQG